MRWLMILLLMLGIHGTALGQAPAIWTPDHWKLLDDESTPTDGEPHLLLVGGRNGMASGLLAARTGDWIRRPVVTVTALRHEDGQAVIPPAAITVRYGSQHHRDAIGEQSPNREGPYMHLSTKPLEQTKTLVSRITVSIPADAAPGVYQGQAQIRATGLTRRVPLTLHVGRGVLPDPTNYVSHVNYPSSPDSVALRYGVPMWSADHFRRMEASFEIFRQLGQSVLHVPVIIQSQTADGNRSNFNHFGSRQGMIRFRVTGRQVQPDFSAFEQFIAEWKRRVGTPQFVVLYVWDISFSDHERNALAGLQAVVTGVDARGATGELLVPYPGTPDSEQLWRQVIGGVRDRVEANGWKRESVLIGIAHDRKPTDRTVDFFNEIAPGIHWNVISHMRGYGIRDGRMTIGNMEVGYHEFPWNPVPRADHRPGTILGGWNSDFPVATISRFHSMQSENDLSHRWLGDGTVGNVGTRNRTNIIGPTRWKIEFWPVPRPDRDGRVTMGSLFNMQGWVNLIRNRTNLGTAGPTGLEPTVYLQNNIESIQDTEARIAIEMMLRSDEIRPKLSDELVDRAHQLIVERARVINLNRERGWAGIDDFDHQQHARMLYDTLGEMQEAAKRP